LVTALGDVVLGLSRLHIFELVSTRMLVVTPDFHHWHHSSDDEAIDK
jgi:sterol desaturase/sphingolipid hydroxylase (fatty acid hydroxylase superfamily)